jgi:exopolyphosphatase/pppGpp-phosphohydrolase
VPKAGLDIGSNSIKIAVVDEAGTVLLDEARIVGLAKGLGERGLFKADRIDAALAAIVELVEKARAVGATDIRAVATSGARRALNA